MKLEQWFSVPIVIDRLIGFENTNNSIKEYILSAEKQHEKENELITQARKKGLFESQWNLFQRNEPSLNKLNELLSEKLILLVSQLNSYDQKIIDTLKIKEQSWFHVTRKGGYFSAHNHPMASWSSVYCVDDGGINDNDDFGVTRFCHPYPQMNCYIDAGNVNLKHPFNSSPLNIKLKTGDLIFFPSFLMHEVSPYMQNGTRITIATNYWIESPLVKIRV